MVLLKRVLSVFGQVV